MRCRTSNLMNENQHRSRKKTAKYNTKQKRNVNSEEIYVLTAINKRENRNVPGEDNIPNE